MIDVWELGEPGVGKLLGSVSHEVITMGGDTMLILAGIFSFILAGATATWSLHRALRRAEERMTERLIQQMRYELLRQQGIQLALTANAVDNDSSGYELELTKRVEDASMEKLLASMRRLKNQDLKIH